MHSRLHRIALAAAFVLSACSSNPAPATTDAVSPPRRIGGDQIDFASVRPPGNTRTDIAVMVGTDGLPEMSTLRVTGSGAGALKDAITEWIGRSTFEPAKAGGVPVRAEFTMKIQSKTTVRTR